MAFTDAKKKRGRKPKTASDRFWAKVRKVGGSGCWVWTASRTAHGHGQFDSETAHRFAYREEHGCIPVGAAVRHTCGNRLCVRPSHLTTVGGKALTSEAHVEIMRLYTEEGLSQKVIGDRYGIGQSTVSSIVRQHKKAAALFHENVLPQTYAEVLAYIDDFCRQYPWAEWSPGHLTLSDYNLSDDSICFCLKEAAQEYIDERLPQWAYLILTGVLSVLLAVPEDVRREPDNSSCGEEPDA